MPQSLLSREDNAAQSRELWSMVQRDSGLASSADVPLASSTVTPLRDTATPAMGLSTALQQLDKPVQPHFLHLLARNSRMPQPPARRKCPRRDQMIRALRASCFHGIPRSDSSTVNSSFRSSKPTTSGALCWGLPRAQGGAGGQSECE